MKNRVFLLILGVFVLTGSVRPALADDDSVLLEGVRRISDEHAVETSDTALERIRDAGEPLYSFVQLADVHHRSGDQHENDYFHRGLSYVNNRIRPAFVVFTGDNISGDSVEHQKQFRSLIDSELDAPAYLIRGDNDEEHFHKVFGSSKWSFNHGGLHFMGTAIDVDETPGKGTGYFSAETILWMKKTLKRSDRPTVVFFHENLWPPTFSDAPRLAHILRSDSDVLFLATGHLHRDLEVSVNGLKQIVSPSLRKSDRHGMKEYRVYRNKLIIVTHEIDGDKYTPAPKYQERSFDQPLPFDAGKEGEWEKNQLPPQKMTYAPELGWYRKNVESVVVNEFLQRIIGGEKEN